jgi:hypothetical protein
LLVERKELGAAVANKFMWIVIAGRGHESEQLGRGFTEDLDDAKTKINEQIDRRPRQHRTDWIAYVLDLDRPKLMSPHAPILGWETVYRVDGRESV